MKFFKPLSALILIILVSNLSSKEGEDYLDRLEVQGFIEVMYKKHGFIKEDLLKLFATAKFQEKVIRIMNRQPEGIMTWTKYKEMMVSEDRIFSGKTFIESYKKELLRAEDIYGVPAEIIASIIGIETRYGRTQGNIRVLDSLMTLSFDYPRRAKFFKIQLEEFLLLAREEGLNTYQVKGSIAGAMGYGQFMPDSYRNYAVDFDFDGKRDILHNPIDAIGSIANFLSKKGNWERNTAVAVKAELTGVRPDLKSSFKPYITVFELGALGIKPIVLMDSKKKVVPVELQLQLDEEQIKEKLLKEALKRNKFSLLLELGSLEMIFEPFEKIATLVAQKQYTEKPKESKYFEYWIGLKNYHALSTYNRSKLYVMAVLEFSNSLEKFLTSK